MTIKSIIDKIIHTYDDKYPEEEEQTQSLPDKTEATFYEKIPPHIMAAYQDAHSRVADAISQSNTTQHLVFQNATYLGSVTAFNFNGTNITINVSAGVASLSVQGGGGGGGLTSYPVSGFQSDGVTPITVSSVSMSVVGAVLTQTGTAQNPQASLTIPNANVTDNSANNDQTLTVTKTSSANVNTFLVKLAIPNTPNKYFVAFGQGTVASPTKWIALNITPADGTIVITNDNAGNITVKLNLPNLGTAGQYLTATGITATPFAWSTLTVPAPINIINALPPLPVTNNIYRFINTQAVNGTGFSVVIKGATVTASTSYLFNGDLITWDGTNWRLLTPNISADYNTSIAIQITSSFLTFNDLNNYLNQRRLTVPVTITILGDLVESVNNINVNHVDSWNLAIVGRQYTENTSTGYTVNGNVGQQIVTFAISGTLSTDILVNSWVNVYGEDRLLAPADNLAINGNCIGTFKVTAITTTSVTVINPNNMNNVLTAQTINLRIKRVATMKSSVANDWLRFQNNANGLEIGDLAIVSDNALSSGNVNTLGLLNMQDSSLYLVGTLSAGVSSSTASTVNPIGLINARIGSDATNNANIAMGASAFMSVSGTAPNQFITTAFGIYQSDIYLASSTASWIFGTGYVNVNSRVTVDGSTNNNNLGTVYGSWYVDDGSSLNFTHCICCNAQTSGLLADNNSRIQGGQLDASSPAATNGYYAVLRGNKFNGLFSSGSSRIALGNTLRASSSSNSTLDLIYAEQRASILIDNVGLGAIVGYIDNTVNPSTLTSAIACNAGDVQIINDVQKLTGTLHYTVTLGTALRLINASTFKLNTATQNFLANNPTSFTGDISLDTKSSAFFNNNQVIFKLTSTGTIQNVITAVDTVNNTITITTPDTNIVVGIKLRLNIGTIDFSTYYTVTNIAGLVLTIRETLPRIMITTDYLSGYGTQAFLLPSDTSYNNADGLIGGQ